MQCNHSIRNNLRYSHCEEAAWVQNLCLDCRKVMVSEADLATAELTASSGPPPDVSISTASLRKYFYNTTCILRMIQYMTQ